MRIHPLGRGAGQLHAAHAAAIPPTRSSPSRKRRASSSRKSAPRPPARKRVSSSRPARLVKGSKAARAYMAKIRRMRKR